MIPFQEVNDDQQPTETPKPPTPTFTPEPTGDGINWTKHPYNPVLDVGADVVGEARVLLIDDGFHMIYVGQDGTQEGGSISPFYGYALGVATSANGKTWDKQESSPIIALTGTDFGMLWHASVFQEGDYYTYYSPGTMGGRVGYRIYLATSSDGLTWTPGDAPVIDLGAPGSYDGVDVLAPFVLFDDGISWTPHPNNPVLTPGEEGEWDSEAV